MKKLTYLLILLAAMSGAAVYAGSLNSFVCFNDEYDADDEDMDENDMDDEDMDDEDMDDEDMDDED
jgi:hypothetical protein